MPKIYTKEPLKFKGIKIVKDEGSDLDIIKNNLKIIIKSLTTSLKCNNIIYEISYNSAVDSISIKRVIREIV